MLARQERLFEVPSVPVARAHGAALALVDLHNGPRDLARLLVDRLQAGDALNAFLLAAGLAQIAEDQLEADVLRLSDVERVLGGSRGAAVAKVASTLSAGRRGARRDLRWLSRWERRMADLVDALADAVAARTLPPEKLLVEAEALRATLPASRAFRDAAIRLPSSFRGFDQHPEDLRRLAERVAAAAPDRERPIAVVGLRTSGSYLAPLLAAMLRKRGYARAIALSARPKHALPRHKRRALRDVLGAGGRVVVTDDPPASGSSIVAVAEALERLGAERGSILLALALFGDELPPALSRWPAAVLPWDEWSVHERLDADAIRSSLEVLWAGRRITAVARLPLEAAPRRGHVSARYRVHVADAPPEDVAVRGAGLGYFGEHALAVHGRLGAWAPELYGVIDGLAFRPWVPEHRRVRSIDAVAAREIAAYADQRRRELAVGADPTVRFAGQDPVWEVASTLLSAAFGRGWRVARIAALDAALRRLLQAARPSVVDGSMGTRHWFVADGGRRLQKVAADQRAFSNRNLACYDAAFDVAAAGAGDHDGGEHLRAAFAGAAGESVGAERWLLYELVALWADRRDRAADAAQTERASARALQRYFARVYLAEAPRQTSGPLCALDVDGVLETDTLGFPSLSPASALALRALLAHGYRPVLATGRSIDEVRERCRAYGLVGGVAEYGAALYETATDRVRPLVGDDDAAALKRLRDALAARSDVVVGTDHRHAVRAWRTNDRGARRGLSEEAVAAALEAAGAGRVRVVPGEGQTDFVPAAVDKATGLRALLDVLDEAPDGTPLALAVGDAVEDVPMLALAQLGRAPANADAAMRASGARRARRPYQAGLAQAVGELIGHAPGACPHCAAPPGAPGRGLVEGVLALRERGPAHMAWRAARLMVRARRDG